MYDLMKADEIYEEMRAEGADIPHELMKLFKDKMPKEYAKLMYMLKYGCHIYSKEMYDEAVHLLKWSDDKGHGAKWDVETIVKLSNIDFNNVDYYKYDFAYAVNMLYSDYYSALNSSEPSYYIKMAKIYLTDIDYPGNPDERAYHDAEKRINYFKD